jgi:glucose-1-phosphate adenylyltransferase
MKALGIIFSNLHDKDVRELTVMRTLASVPFGGRYRLVDFALSSMVNSGVEKVGIITKNNYQSLMDHVGSGKHWDLARKNGGLIVLPPYGAYDYGTLYSNRLEALMGIKSFIENSKEEYVFMSDCDNVANINYSEVLASHIRNNADITMVYRIKNIVKSEKVRGVLDIEPTNGKIKKYSLTDKASGETPVFANEMVMKKSFILSLLENAARDGLKSFSRDILVKKADKLRMFGYKFDGYFASIDSMANYLKHNLELLNPYNRKSLFPSGSPIFTKVKDSMPTYIAKTAVVKNSMIADGCRIEGTVENSVLFRGVTVSKGAVVRNSVIMQDSHISTDSNVNCIIADKSVVIREKRILSGCEQLPYYISKNTNL